MGLALTCNIDNIVSSRRLTNLESRFESDCPKEEAHTVGEPPSQRGKDERRMGWKKK